MSSAERLQLVVARIPPDFRPQNSRCSNRCADWCTGLCASFCRDRLRSSNKERKVGLERFKGLRLAIGQSERRDKGLRVLFEPVAPQSLSDRYFARSRH
jgi:hypothetical protein